MRKNDSKLITDKFSISRFDEVHFSQYASYYIKQKFFFDVHPPVSKLIDQ
jgi:dolichyl-phosphate-mannose--protein O-mannosyl transferase